jgi:tRNA dimethylallyltransferase
VLYPVVAIVGPTAVGKTALSLSIGRALGAEVVSADSRQIYRYMNIGTAKPTPAERADLPHHLIDVVDPDQSLTLAEYTARAARCVEEIAGRGRLPLLVGGTGLYVHAVLEGYVIPEVAPDPAYRAALEAEAASFGGAALGSAALHARLAQVDPVAAARIDARNVRRVIRALEVYATTGQPISALQRREAPPYRTLTLGLTMPRPTLYTRIDERVESMISRGLVDEVHALLARGYHADLPSMSGLGYRQIAQHLRGETSLDGAVALIKRHTRRFVRQQYNWFRLADPRIAWLDAAAIDVGAVASRVERFLRERD